MDDVLDPMDWLDQLAGSFGNMRSDSGEMTAMQMQAELDRQTRLGGLSPLAKAITTGDGPVEIGDTGGRAVRNEFIHGALSNESFDEEHAVFFNRVPKPTVQNTAIQWVAQDDVGQDGDGFLGENGRDGAFNGDESDGDFRREIENVKFLHDVRRTGIVTGMVSNVVDPATNQAKNAVRVIKKNANLACYHGDAGTNRLSFNGVKAQILKGVRRNAEAKVVLVDAAGYTLDKEIQQEVCKVIGEQLGDPRSQFMSLQAHSDLMVSLFPQQRDSDPGTGTMGMNKESYLNPYSTRRIEYVLDPMLRRNQPLVIKGKGQDGKPRSPSQASPKALSFLATPWVTSSGTAAIAAGTGYFWNNYTTNEDAAGLATAPATPSSHDGSGNGNRLAQGTYYLAVSIVHFGRESEPWVLGASEAGSIASASGLAVADGEIIKMVLDPSKIANLSNYKREQIRFRIYRCDTVPTSVKDFDFLMETGLPEAGNAIAYDNGMYIPGTESSFVISDRDSDGSNLFFAQLCPLLKRELPHNLLSDVFGYIQFGALILKKRDRHVWIRNIGRKFRT